MGGQKLKSGVNWSEAVKQKGVKQGLGCTSLAQLIICVCMYVYIYINWPHYGF